MEPCGIDGDDESGADHDEEEDGRAELDVDDDGEEDKEPTLGNIIQDIKDSRSPATSKSSNTSPQLPSFSAVVSSATAIAVPVLAAAAAAAAVDRPQPSVESAASSITFTLSDDEISDDSNASHHNMRTAVETYSSMQQQQRTAVADSSASSDKTVVSPTMFTATPASAGFVTGGEPFFRAAAAAAADVEEGEIEIATGDDHDAEIERIMMKQSKKKKKAGGGVAAATMEKALADNDVFMPSAKKQALVEANLSEDNRLCDCDKPIPVKRDDERDRGVDMADLIKKQPNTPPDVMAAPPPPPPASAGATATASDQIQYSPDGRPKLVVSIELDLIKLLAINSQHSIAAALEPPGPVATDPVQPMNESDEPKPPAKSIMSASEEKKSTASSTSARPSHHPSAAPSPRLQKLDQPRSKELSSGRERSKIEPKETKSSGSGSSGATRGSSTSSKSSSGNKYTSSDDTASSSKSLKRTSLATSAAPPLEEYDPENAIYSPNSITRADHNQHHTFNGSLNKKLKLDVKAEASNATSASDRSSGSARETRESRPKVTAPFPAPLNGPSPVPPFNPSTASKANSSNLINVASSAGSSQLSSAKHAAARIGFAGNKLLDFLDAYVFRAFSCRLRSGPYQSFQIDTNNPTIIAESVTVFCNCL